MYQLTKEQAKTLRWLLKAAGGKYRDVLSHINTSRFAAAASDGHRLHVTPLIPELPTAEGISPATTVPASDCNIDFTTSEASFPNWRSIIPKEEPVATATINPKFLRDAIHGAKEPVKLVLYGENKPMEIQTSEDRYVIIMPMNDSGMPFYKPE